MKMRYDIDKNISKIIDRSEHNFAMLFNHPKLNNPIFTRDRTTSNNRSRMYS